VDEATVHQTRDALQVAAGRCWSLLVATRPSLICTGRIRAVPRSMLHPIATNLADFCTGNLEIALRFDDLERSKEDPAPLRRELRLVEAQK
jgi:hypothetical protein